MEIKAPANSLCWHNRFEEKTPCMSVTEGKAECMKHGFKQDDPLNFPKTWEEERMQQGKERHSVT